MTQTTRDIKYDILKTIGIFCIILAHSQPPDMIQQIRNFDVPLMVLVSGSLLANFSRPSYISIGKYLSHRIPRLIAPVWLFYICFYGSSFLIYPLLHRQNKFTFMSMVATLSLGMVRALGEIDYVWIIRVFVLIAFVAPLLLNIRKKLKIDGLFILLLLGIYIVYEVAFWQTNKNYFDNDLFQSLVGKVLFYLVPYGCIFGLGMVLPKLKSKIKLFISLLCFSLFVVLALALYKQSGSFILTQNLKSPPRIYYLSYALSISIILYLIGDYLVQYTTSLKSFFVFVSSSTLWIYLWHTFFLHYWQFTLTRITSLAHNFMIIFLGITLLSFMTTYYQKKIVSALIAKTQFGQKYSNVLETLFLK